MDRKLTLTPEELYYLGSLLQAKYIDYAYVAAMDGMKGGYALFETETRAALVSSGILMEDFSGEITIDPAAAALLKPVFFGEFEACVDICEYAQVKKVRTYRFHVHDGIITMVTNVQGKLVLSEMDQLSVQDSISGILPETYRCKTAEHVEKLSPESVTRVIAVKNNSVGKSAVVKMYVESSGIVYQEGSNGIESVTREMFITSTLDIVKGV